MREGTSKRIRVRSRTTKRRVGTYVYRGRGQEGKRARGQEGKREAERGRWEAGGAQMLRGRREEHQVYTRQENPGEIGGKEEGNV